MSEANLLAVCTSKVAGRAWIPVSATMWKSFEAIVGFSFNFTIISSQCDNPYKEHYIIF